ncbi:MAG: SurA N-terminal domain-containing protein [bacterium]
MSLMTFRRKMASTNFVSIVMWIIIVVFVASIFLYVGTGNNKPSQQSGLRVTSGTLLKINNQKIKGSEYQDILVKIKGEQPLNINNALQIRKEAINKIIDDTIFNQSVKQMDANVSDKEAMTEMGEQLRMTVLLPRRLEVEKQAKDEAAKAKTPADKKKLKSADVLYKEWMTEIINGQSTTQADKDKYASPNDDKFIDWYKNVYLKKDPASFADQKKGVIATTIGKKYLEQQASQMGAVNLMDEKFAKNARTMKVDASWIVYAPEGNGKDALDKAMAKANKGFEAIKKSPAAFKAEVANSSDMMSQYGGGSIYGGVTGGKIPPVAEYNAFTMKKGQISAPFLAEYKNIYTNESQPAYIILRVDSNMVPNPEAKDVDWDKMKTPEMFKHKMRIQQDMGKQLIALNKQYAVITTEDLLVQSFLDEIGGDLKKTLEDRKQLLANAKSVEDMDELTKAAVNYDVGKKATDVKDRIKYLSDAAVGVDNAAALHYDLGMAFMDDKKQSSINAIPRS